MQQSNNLPGHNQQVFLFLSHHQCNIKKIMTQILCCCSKDITGFITLVNTGGAVESPNGRNWKSCLSHKISGDVCATETDTHPSNLSTTIVDAICLRSNSVHPSTLEQELLLFSFMVLTTWSAWEVFTGLLLSEVNSLAPNLLFLFNRLAAAQRNQSDSTRKCQSFGCSVCPHKCKIKKSKGVKAVYEYNVDCSGNNR